MDKAVTTMKAFCSSIWKLGGSMEPAFTKLAGENRELSVEIAELRK